MRSPDFCPVRGGEPSAPGSPQRGNVPAFEGSPLLVQYQRDSIAAVDRAWISAVDSLVTSPWVAPTAP